MYYIAYGSNLNLKQMNHRCPGATVAGKTTINNHKLVFRGMDGNTHATVELAEGYQVPVLVWKINKQHERTLDRYEGVPKYYTKEELVIKVNGEAHKALIYIMASGNELGCPNERYYSAIEEGYMATGFDLGVLEKALHESCYNSKYKEIIKMKK